jgi:hypothetical protein
MHSFFDGFAPITPQIHERSTYSPWMVADRIRHTVAFTLDHPEGSAGERDFLEEAARLATVPGVYAAR